MIVLGSLESASLPMLNELFSPDVTVEALTENIGSKSATSLKQGLVDEKMSGRRGRPHQPFFSSEN